MQFSATTINMLKEGTWQTIYMVFMSSVISYLIGIPLGIALMVTCLLYTSKTRGVRLDGHREGERNFRHLLRHAV